MTEQVFIDEVQRLRQQMVRVATRYLEDVDGAQDMVQDALLKLWSMHDMLSCPMDRLAFTVLKHRCLDELRKREHYRRAEGLTLEQLEVADTDANDLQALEERERQLMKAVQKLPSKQRLLLQMRYVRGTDIDTLSQILGSSQDSIRQSLSRARRSVLKALGAVVAACIFFILGVGTLIQLHATRQFNNLYEGSYLIVQGERIDNPQQIQGEIAETLLQADEIEQLFREDAYQEAEKDILDMLDNPLERKQMMDLLK